MSRAVIVTVYVDVPAGPGTAGLTETDLANAEVKTFVSDPEAICGCSPRVYG